MGKFSQIVTLFWSFFLKKVWQFGIILPHFGIYYFLTFFIKRKKIDSIHIGNVSKNTAYSVSGSQKIMRISMRICRHTQGLCAMGYDIKLEFMSKIETFVKNRNFCEKSKLLSKIETFVKNRNFCQKSTLLSKIETFVKRFCVFQSGYVDFCLSVSRVSVF